MNTRRPCRFLSTLPFLHFQRRRDHECLRPQLELLEDRSMLAAMISGAVSVGGHGFKNAEVFLYEADTDSAALIGQNTADDDGIFHIEYDDVDDGSILYLLAADGSPATSEVILAGVAGEAGSELLDFVTINELTTVATVYSLSQFIDDPQNIFGQSPGLPNAVSTVFTLVDGDTGTPAEVVSNFNNGTTKEQNIRTTEALLTMNTLANIVDACATDASGMNCDTFFALATPPGGVTPTNTIAALQNINQNPLTLDNEGLFALSQMNTTYEPALAEAPDSWLLALHFTEGGFSGPGRIAFDTAGNVWSNNNFQLNPPGGNNPGKNIAVLNSAGEPILKSPIFGLGLGGSGYGTAVAPDGSIWIASFVGSKMSKFSADGHPELAASSKRVPNAADPTERVRTLDHPMGIAIDQEGNIWIPNSGPSGNLSEFGSLTVYLHGDPKQAITLKDRSKISNPFNVAIDDQGRAWVVNSGPIGGSVMILKIVDGKFCFVTKHPIESPALSKAPDDLTVLPYSDFHAPRTIAIDVFGIAWVNNIEANEITRIRQTGEHQFEATDIPLDGLIAGWGLGIDSSNTIYVVSNPVFKGKFDPTNQVVVVDASDPMNPVQMGTFTNGAMQITTAVQIDQSGNVWTVNNWSLKSRPRDLVGGDGLIKFIGLASPTAAPLIGSPVDPAVGAEVEFISPIDESPSSLPGTSNGRGRPTWTAPPRPARDAVFNNYQPSPAALEFALPESPGEEEDNESDTSLAVVWPKPDLELESLFDGSIEDSLLGKYKVRRRS
jgi:streptogramin lyase